MRRDSTPTTRMGRFLDWLEFYRWSRAQTFWLGFMWGCIFLAAVVGLATVV